jgi:predicted house-cleaning noncanonical NTP pyrophosphatase (MazG superfamily)
MTYLFNESFGGKLDGLRQIPKLWVPTFFVISSELHKRCLGNRSSSGSSTLFLVEPAERIWIESEVRRFGDQPQAMSLIVRSNATGEGLEQRGLLRSVRCDGTVEAILAAAAQVFEDAYCAAATIPMGLIVQVYCSPALKGHFSNERRVSEEIRRWLCEMDSTTVLGQETLPRVFKCRVEKAKASPERQLLCANRRELVGILRIVGKYFYDRKERRHLEWVWDGARLWVVQNDHAPDTVGDSPEATVVKRTKSVDAGALSLFRLFSTNDAKKWQKLKCVETFRSLGLPSTPLFILHGGRDVSLLADGVTRPELTSDLTELTKGPVVIRTDIAGQTVLFANRTDCLSKLAPARKFLQDTARDLVNAGVDSKQICFIAHRFIPASASAFSMATAVGNRVSIDALWGLPDGLEFCAHDSFEVDTRIGEIVARKIRHKPTFLAAQPDDSWKTAPLGAPWDWRPSLDDATVREIATLTKKVAAALKKTIVIMWFARVPSGSGYPTLIPWRYTTEDEPRQVESGIGEYFQRQPFYVRNSLDIGVLRTTVGPISSVILQPDGPHLRDKHFLEELGNVVRSLGLRIDLEGSPLSHTYYVLKRTGAHVACIDPIKPKSVRRKFVKLVRDKVPVRIQRQGEKVVVVNLPEGELLDVLKAKIVEEAMEVLSAASPETLQEEMADVLEVLIALCRIRGGSLKKLEKVAAKKRRSIGGFGKGMMLVETEETPLLEVQTGDGLFDTGGVKRTRNHQAIVAAGRRPKTRRDRIIIPLVPSVPDRLRGPSRIYFRNPDLEFEVWYREKLVEVILIREGSRVSSDQLVFPFSEDLNP